MKLSEAIRLGSMLRPQGFGDTERQRRKYFGLFGPVVRETCALGAAIEAGGIGHHEEVQALDGHGFRGTIKAGAKTRVMEFPQEWLNITWQVRPCPVVNCLKFDHVHRQIPHLNDDHRWTREAIADWVASLEDQRDEVVTVFALEGREAVND